MAKTANQIVTDNLSRWMTASKTLKSQSALHRVSKVAQSHISRIIRGEANPTVTMLEDIAKPFGKTAIDLLTPTLESTQLSVCEPQTQYQTQTQNPEEKILLDGYHHATPEDRETLLFIAERALRNFNKRTGT